MILSMSTLLIKGRETAHLAVCLLAVLHPFGGKGCVQVLSPLVNGPHCWYVVQLGEFLIDSAGDCMTLVNDSGQSCLWKMILPLPEHGGDFASAFCLYVFEQNLLISCLPVLNSWQQVDS